jgi:hypothetical protein
MQFPPPRSRNRGRSPSRGIMPVIEVSCLASPLLSVHLHERKRLEGIGGRVHGRKLAMMSASS